MEDVTRLKRLLEEGREVDRDLVKHYIDKLDAYFSFGFEEGTSLEQVEDFLEREDYYVRLFVDYLKLYENMR